MTRLWNPCFLERPTTMGHRQYCPYLDQDLAMPTVFPSSSSDVHSSTQLDAGGLLDGKGRRAVNISNVFMMGMFSTLFDSHLSVISSECSVRNIGGTLAGGSSLLSVDHESAISLFSFITDVDNFSSVSVVQVSATS